MIPRYSIDFTLKDLLKNLIEIFRMTNTTIVEGSNIFLNSGSSALRVALRSLSLREGSKIALPLLTCENVALAVISEGFVPVFVDFMENLPLCSSENYYDAVQKHDAKAIIAVSMWGYPIDYQELRNTIPNIPIIQDCALSTGSEINNKDDGYYSDISFSSYGIGKPITLGFGGLLNINSTSVINDLIIEEENGKTLIQKSLKVFLKSLAFNKPIYKFSRFVNPPITNLALSKQYDIKIIPSTQFMNLVNSKMVELRKKIKNYQPLIDDLSSILHEREITLLEKPISGVWNNWMLPILLPEKIIKRKFLEKTNDEGFESITPYLRTFELAKRYWGYQGSCVNTENILDKLVLIPSIYQYKKIDLFRIQKMLSKF
jgi:dTDP-4-amino-4,6-dideoxygalactose transaminase